MFRAINLDFELTALRKVLGFLIPTDNFIETEPLDCQVDSDAIIRAWKKVADGQFSQTLLHWFLGFVEGHLFVEPPKFWTECVLALRLRGSNEVQFPSPRMSPYENLGEGVFGSPKLKIDFDAQSFTLCFAERPETQLRLSNSLLSETPLPFRAISGTADEDKFYIAVHSRRSEEYSLVCLDYSSTVLWTAVIDGAKYAGQLPEFDFFHFVEITVCDDSVLVFGVSNEAVYIELVSKSEGKSLLHFSSLLRDN
ncbi:MAG: hypothetical protein JNK57_04410 [Planctomycetaceae bacterium]|nr:hypothetical protein [Planctomycetaceae bacterium]